MIGLAGFIGAIAPGLAQLAAAARAEAFVWPSFSFYVGTAIMGLLGMAVAMFGKETVPWKAFMQGMGAPALFSSAGTVATGVALAVMPMVYAQPPIMVLEPRPVTVIVSGAKEPLYSHCGDTVVIESDGMRTKFSTPCDRDTVYIDVQVVDPAIRRGLVQAIMPMSKMNERFERKIIVKEVSDGKSH